MDGQDAPDRQTHGLRDGDPGHPGRDRARLQNAGSAGRTTHIAAPTVSKLLKQLQRAGLVNSTRGTHGGYQLARDPRTTSARPPFSTPSKGPSRSPIARSAPGTAASNTPAQVGRDLAAAERRHPQVAVEISLAQLAGLDSRDARDADRARAQTVHAPAKVAGMSTDPKSMENLDALLGEVVPARLRHRHRFGHAAARPRRRRGALHLAQEARAASS